MNTFFDFPVCFRGKVCSRVILHLVLARFHTHMREGLSKDWFLSGSDWMNPRYDIKKGFGFFLERICLKIWCWLLKRRFKPDEGTGTSEGMYNIEKDGSKRSDSNGHITQGTTHTFAQAWIYWILKTNYWTWQFTVMDNTGRKTHGMTKRGSWWNLFVSI